MSSMAVKRRPFMVLFIFGNRKKSHGAMSGEYGGWGIVTVLFLGKNSRKIWNKFVLYTFVNFTTQCGESRHTDIGNFATLIHTKKKIHCVGDFYRTVR